MDCEKAREHLLDERRGRLPAELRAELSAHLQGCAACRRAQAADRALDEVLEQRLPQYPASLALKRRLAAKWESPPEPVIERARRRWPAVAAVGLALAALVLLFFFRARRSDREIARLTEEAANDHLRVLASEHPVEVESSEMHQVKPWFTGRLDFAPVISFLGDDEFPLQGGAVGYFLDRKAATLVFKRRLHTISLFIFRADGLSFPARGGQPMGRVSAHAMTVRGFSVLLWKDGELGYALVSDLNPSELSQLGTRVAGGS
jgi:anti-sigma factor RsiW